MGFWEGVRILTVRTRREAVGAGMLVKNLTFMERTLQQESYCSFEVAVGKSQWAAIWI